MSNPARQTGANGAARPSSAPADIESLLVDLTVRMGESTRTERELTLTLARTVRTFRLAALLLVALLVLLAVMIAGRCTVGAQLQAPTRLVGAAPLTLSRAALPPVGGSASHALG